MTIDDIFNNKFVNFAEKYISNDLESINQRDDGHLFFGKSRDDIAKKLKNNEWYLTPDGFTVIFARLCFIITMSIKKEIYVLAASYFKF